MNPANVLLAFAWAILLAVGMPTNTNAGEGHDHGAAPSAAVEQVLPVVIATSETFELVGRLHADEMSILIDRIGTNEPVMGGKLTVDFNGRSAVAEFHNDHGDYSLTDAAILKQLREAGNKALTFTLIVGNESDLLAGEMDIHDSEASATVAHGRTWIEYATWAGAAVLGLLLFAAAFQRLGAARKARLGGVA